MTRQEREIRAATANAGEQRSILLYNGTCLHNICLQAQKVEAILDERFLNAQAWCSLGCTAQSEWTVTRSVANKENVIPVECDTICGPGSTHAK